MAKKAPKKPTVKKKGKPLPMPTLNTKPPTSLSGECKCPDGALTVRLPHHARVEMQMLTAHCRTCGDTFYLTEKH